MNTLLSKMARRALQAVALAGCFAISLQAWAEMPTQPKPMWESAESSDAEVMKDARRDPNKYCADCHGHLGHFKHEGKHFQHGTVSPNNGEPLKCTSCHGNISENHRKGVRDVMRFYPYGKKPKKPELERSVSEQNQVCMACHSVEKLREKFWAHDTHAAKIACANCHQLHPEKEPMMGIDDKKRIKLCVDCHTRVREHREKQQQEQQAKENK